MMDDFITPEWQRKTLPASWLEPEGGQTKLRKKDAAVQTNMTGSPFGHCIHCASDILVRLSPVFNIFRSLAKASEQHTATKIHETAQNAL